MALDSTFQNDLLTITRGHNSALVGNQGGKATSITCTTTNLDVQLWGWDPISLAPVKLVATPNGQLAGAGVVTSGAGAMVDFNYAFGLMLQELRVHTELLRNGLSIPDDPETIRNDPSMPQL